METPYYYKITLIQRLIRVKLQEWYDLWHVISSEKYGLMSLHSTEEQAIKLADTIVMRLNKRETCSVVFMDEEKAFYKCSMRAS